MTMAAFLLNMITAPSLVAGRRPHGSVSPMRLITSSARVPTTARPSACTLASPPERHDLVDLDD